jgi:hypothetical protein
MRRAPVAGLLLRGRPQPECLSFHVTQPVRMIKAWIGGERAAGTCAQGRRHRKVHAPRTHLFVGSLPRKNAQDGGSSGQRPITDPRRLREVVSRRDRSEAGDYPQQSVAVDTAVLTLAREPTRQARTRRTSPRSGRSPHEPPPLYSRTDRTRRVRERVTPPCGGRGHGTCGPRDPS